MADERTTEQGNHIDGTLIRSFTRTALEHDAVHERVNNLLFEHVVERKYHPSVVAASLRPFIDEILETATSADWQQIADELATEAREALTA